MQSLPTELSNDQLDEKPNTSFKFFGNLPRDSSKEQQDLLARVNKMVEEALSKALSRLNILRVTSWERCDGRFNNRLW